MITIKRTHLTFSAIKKPPSYIRALWDQYAPPFIIQHPSPLVEGHQILTREAALTLAELHPLLVSEKHECLCNQRLLALLTPRLDPDDRIPVGIIPKSTRPEQIKQLVLTDILTSSLLYASMIPARDIFYLSEQLPDKSVRNISPALNQSVATRATLLGTQRGTLYKWKQARAVN